MLYGPARSGTSASCPSAAAQPARRHDDGREDVESSDGRTFSTVTGLAEKLNIALREKLADFKAPRGTRLIDDPRRSTVNKAAKQQLRQALMSPSA
jgi:hypothetical protein